MTTSQCSKSQPSRRIVSFGGRLDQLGLGSLSEDEVVLVAKHRAGATRPTAVMAPARGRRRLMREREERVGAAEREAEVDALRARREAQASVLDSER